MAKGVKLRTGSTAAFLVAMVLVLGAVMYSSGYLPFHLRHDGIYASGNAPACSGTLIDRPRLYLPEPDKKRSGHYRVTQVIDGDTIEIERSGKKERIRLIGIDTAEVGRSEIDPNSHGWKATMFVFDQLEKDPQVKLRYDKEHEDKYGRTLAYVYLTDGRMLNELLLKEGWAKTLRIPPNTKHADDFAKIEANR